MIMGVLVGDMLEEVENILAVWLDAVDRPVTFAEVEAADLVSGLLSTDDGVCGRVLCTRMI